MPEEITQQAILGTPSNPEGPAPRIMAGDSLTGEKVVNERGEKLGTITHIMLDVARGTIAYAVLSFGGILGLGDKLFAVPWGALALDVEDKWFVLRAFVHHLQSRHRIPAMLLNPTHGMRSAG